MTQEHTSHEKIVAKRELETHEVKEVLNFLKKNGTMIGYGLVALIAVFSTSSYMNTKKIHRNAQASQMLMNANSDVELQLIIDKYANTPAAPGALLALARSAYNQGEYEKAQAGYNEFLKKFSKHDMAAVAAFGQAASLEAQNQLDAAVKEYQKAADQHKGSFVAPMALFNKGRLLAAQNKTAEAIAAFEGSIAADTTGSWSAQAEGELSKLR